MSAPDGARSSANRPPICFALKFELPGLPRTTNGSHGHWRVKAAHSKTWKQKVFTACWHLRPLWPLKAARIVLTRVSSVEPDYDNLVISFKPVIDGLRQAGVIADDKMSVIGAPTYAWRKCKPGLGHVVIEVFQREEQV